MTHKPQMKVSLWRKSLLETEYPASAASVVDVRTTS